jgi:methionyl-tRNA synthetase
MEKNYKRTLITTALPYANGPVHIGHLAGVYVPADIYARYLRANGKEVLLVGGSDEHGVPITIKARKCDPAGHRGPLPYNNQKFHGRAGNIV